MQPRTTYLKNKGKKDEDKKVYRVAEKRNLITRDPDILVVSLNRYAPISNGGFEKLEGHVHFKEMLDMQPYMDQRYRFLPLLFAFCQLKF